MPVLFVHKPVPQQKRYVNIILNSILINLVHEPGDRALSNILRVPYVVYHNQPVHGSECRIRPNVLHNHPICCWISCKSRWPLYWRILISPLRLTTVRSVHGFSQHDGTSISMVITSKNSSTSLPFQRKPSFQG